MGPGCSDPKDMEVNNRIMDLIRTAAKNGEVLPQITITEAEHDALKRLNCHHADVTSMMGIPVVVRG